MCTGRENIIYRTRNRVNFCRVVFFPSADNYYSRPTIQIHRTIDRITLAIELQDIFCVCRSAAVYDRIAISKFLMAVSVLYFITAFYVCRTSCGMIYTYVIYILLDVLPVADRRRRQGCFD